MTHILTFFCWLSPFPTKLFSETMSYFLVVGRTWCVLYITDSRLAYNSRVIVAFKQLNKTSTVICYLHCLLVPCIDCFCIFWLWNGSGVDSKSINVKKISLEYRLWSIFWITNGDWFMNWSPLIFVRWDVTFCLLFCIRSFNVTKDLVLNFNTHLKLLAIVTIISIFWTIKS